MQRDLFTHAPTAVPASELLVRDASGHYRAAALDDVLNAALALLAARVPGATMDSPAVVRDFLRCKLGGLEHEVFAVLHLDSQHRVIEYVEMFRGSLTQTAVYPREVAKEVLARNAAAVVLVHNHPSGVPEPSSADQVLTNRIKDTLALIDVRVLDHLIVAGAQILSFAERGLI